MITRFDRNTVKNLRVELDDLLKKFGEKHGIMIQTGTARFTNSNVNWKLTMVAPGAVSCGGDDTGSTIQETEFLLHCNSYGMQKSDLNTTIILRGQPNKIVGLNPRRHKYPIICENQNGTRYVYTASEVNQALLAKKVAAAGG
jgi:hypothetical protein